MVRRVTRTGPLSRSRHTDPLAIRAARRLAAPWEPRSKGDLSLRRRVGRTLKGLDGRVPSAAEGRLRAGAFPRIVEAPARPGFHHPAGCREVGELLRSLSPEAIYGLRSVELCRGPAWSHGTIPCFGRLRVPGRIALHDLPRPPWRLAGRIEAGDAEALGQAGARVTVDHAAGTTMIEWPGASLTDFMLFDVLLHEIGHHVLQHGKGKRRVRIARTRDHEAFAKRFASLHRAARRGAATTS